MSADRAPEGHRIFIAGLPDGTFVYKETPPDVVWPEPPADLDPSIDWRLGPDIDPADRRSSTPRARGEPNQDDADAEARERYNREARAKAERRRQAGGWPPDPINNPDHPLYQPPDQLES